MPVQTLTNQFLSTLPSIVPPKGATSFFDTEIKGFILEHRASGGATYYFRYRDAAQRLRMAHIGRLADLTLATARARAHAMRQLLLEGGDPAVERHRFADVPTLAELVDQRYLPYVKLHKRSWATDECVLRLHLLPVFGAYRIHHIQRADVVKLMQALRQQGYSAGIGSSSNEIRDYRKHLLTLLDFENYGFATSSSDFFSISACRDLLFHIQENRMNLKVIDGFIKDHGLNFLGFDINSSVSRSYKSRFPNDLSATNLDNWRAYEEENPDIFVGMYQFWVQKIST